MKKTIWIIVIIATTGLVLFKLIGNKKTSESLIYNYDKEKPVTVDVKAISYQNILEDRVYTGSFGPNREVKISAETQGKIIRIFVDEGSYVQTGQKLIQLDTSLLELQLKTIEVQIKGLQDDVNRFTILAKADAVQGVQLEKVKLGLESAELQKSTLLEQINKAAIKAPFNGIITAKLSEMGAFAAPGIPLLQITDIDWLKFRINVPENELKQFYSNPSYSISADVFPNIPLKGELTMVGSKANPGNSFPVQFQVKNTERLDIKSGMFGKVHVSNTDEKQQVAIPSSAIVNTSGKTQVYVVMDGKAVLKTVTTSKNMGNKTIIAGGLKEGDIIVTKGFINLFDGAGVLIGNQE